LFSIFKKKPKQSFSDFSFLGVDIHSHLIPGIDDGAKDMDESLELIKGMQELGFEKIITTPHVMEELYPNSSLRIKALGEELKTQIQEKKIGIALAYSAEYCVDENFQKVLDTDDLIPFPENYILIELSFISAPPLLEERIFQLVTKGYTPILAHPERYLYWSENFSYYERLKEMGCLFQINLMSLSGTYGDGVKKNAKKMLKAKLFDLAGTDVHNLHHIQQLKLGLEKGMFHDLNNYQFKNKQLFLELHA